MNRTATLDQIESLNITDTLLEVAVGEICRAKASVFLALKELDNVECPSDPVQYRRIMQDALKTATEAIEAATQSAALTSKFAAQSKL